MEWVMISTGNFYQFQNDVNACLKQGWTVKDIKTDACASNQVGNDFLVIVVLEKK